MNPANATSRPASATTSTTAPSHENGDGPNSAPMTEGEFLEQQAEAARSAIVDAFADLQTDLAKGADPRVWMKSHPWLTLASAAVAGFATAAAVVPSKEQQALSKLERLHRAMNAGQAKKEQVDGVTEKKGHAGLIGLLIHEVIAVIKPAIVGIITAQFSGQPVNRDGDPSGNNL